jgi:hypothetical protein
MTEQDVTIETLVGRVFSAQHISKLRHWTSSNAAQHAALAYFYDSTDEALDALVESWQGHFDTVVGDVDVPNPEVKNIRDYISDEADWIEANRDEIAQDSPHIANLVDALVAVYTKTKDMLRRT